MMFCGIIAKESFVFHLDWILKGDEYHLKAVVYRKVIMMGNLTKIQKQAKQLLVNIKLKPQSDTTTVLVWTKESVLLQ